MPKISLYGGKFLLSPNVAEWSTWRELAALIGEPKPFPEKDDKEHPSSIPVPMFSNVEIVPGATLAKEEIRPETFRAVHFGVFDLDGRSISGSKDKIPFSEDEIAAVLADLDVDYIVASSWHYAGDGTFRGRIILPFSRTLLPSEWVRVWPVLNNKYLKGLADSSCVDLKRRYWVPSFQEGSGVRPLWIVNDQHYRAVDVDACLAEAPTVGSNIFSTGRATTPTRGSLEALAATWFKSSRLNTQKLAKVLRAVAKGESFAAEGDRDNTLFQICGDLVTRWPNLDPYETAALFAPSLQAMELEASGAPTVEKAADMLQRRQQLGLQERSVRIRQAIGRDEPYTPEEIDHFCVIQGITLNELRHLWVLQKDNTYYTLVEGTYRGPYSEKEFRNAARRDLSPAAHLDLDLVSDRNTRPKTIEELVRDFGTVIDGIEVDMAAQQATYDVETRILTESPCPMRVLEPEHDPQIDQWFKLLGGERWDVLEQWLACTPRVSEPLAALYLAGVRNAGKSLLAEGIARLWGPRPTQINEVLGAAFNEQSAKNPLVHVDEAGPLQGGLGFKTSHLRWLIQTRIRPLNRKFKAPATLKGAVRLVFCTNDGQGGATTDENLTENDIEAISERILYIPVGTEASRYLDELKKNDPEIFDRWVDGCGIARHVLWLQQNVPVTKSRRFLVPGDSNELLHALTTSSGVRSEVCQWCIGYLQNPNPVKQNPAFRNLVRVEGGNLLVNAKAIYSTWQQYLPNDRNPPKASAINKALSGLARGERVFRKVGGTMIAYRQIVLDFLATWGENTGYMTTDEIVTKIVDLEAAE